MLHLHCCPLLQLSGDVFDVLYVSPLQRARETAAAITAGREELRTITLPALREVDLYSFQGLLKAEGKARFGDAFASWQRTAATFSIDGHAPVRELWYRCVCLCCLKQCSGSGLGSFAPVLLFRLMCPCCLQAGRLNTA